MNEYFLFDAQGRPYKFESENEVEGNRVDAKAAPGVGMLTGHAPANWEQIAGTEVEGRHKGIEGPLDGYHMAWERGPLWINRPDLGLVGIYSCVHSHLGYYNSFASIDFDYPMYRY